MSTVPEIPGLETLDVSGRWVLLRVDINSPIDRRTGEIANDARIDKSLPTIRDLSDRGARLVIIAHQGDSLDYHNLVSLEPHAEVLAIGRASKKVRTLKNATIYVTLEPCSTRGNT